LIRPASSVHLAHHQEREAGGEQDVGGAAAPFRALEHREPDADRARAGQEDDLQPFDHAVLDDQTIRERHVHRGHDRHHADDHRGECGGQMVQARATRQSRAARTHD
jgi:hypothetical protein